LYDRKQPSFEKAPEPIQEKIRNTSTSAEIAFWKLIKNKKFEGRKFRRQHSIGNFIVDFYCPAEKLIIELDGNPHSDTLQIQKDIERDKYLGDLGFSVLRFENRVIFQDPEYILDEIRKLIHKKD
jgi:very-short-patch-repair endonuclease